MARARRGARPCGARRSARLTDRRTGSDRLREAEGEARTSGTCGGRGGRAPRDGGGRAPPPRDGGGRAPGTEEAGPPGTEEAATKVEANLGERGG